MGTWGTAIFADDLAADVRGDWRDLVLDGHESAAATARVIAEYEHAAEDPDASVVFWLALAAAQMETGRLQDAVRDRALAIIDAGGDVSRWADEDEGAAHQRQQVLYRLADKLRGPQPKPKKLRRQKPLGQAFELGDAIRVRSASGEREALAVVVAHADGSPRGTFNPVVELLAWEGRGLPSPEQMRTLPTVMNLNDIPGREPHYRPKMWTIFTARKDQVFHEGIGEVVAQGVDRSPAGDHRRLDASTAVGGSSLSWTALQKHLDQEYADDLRHTLEAESNPGKPRGWFRRG